MDSLLHQNISRGVTISFEEAALVHCRRICFLATPRRDPSHEFQHLDPPEGAG
jgi:hypothetical protein